MADGARPVRARGHALIRDPLLNKGSAFTPAERRALGLEGLLPQRPVTMEIQRARILENLDRMAEPLDKYVALAGLQDRNEHLFFDVLVHRIEELLPVVYTPTVGLATQRFSHVFQRGRGAWITPEHRGRVAEVLANAAAGRTIRLIVVTDNESILGIGDQGAGGILISIGKLSIYTAAAGVDPAGVLPVSLDVGTDNESLLADPLYLGHPARRLRGAAYDALVDEFVAAVMQLYPDALVQWEDFRKDNALRVLERHRSRLPSFNDDIQGTGAVALAGILTSGRATGRTLADERILINGGGAAGLGIARQLRAGMARAGMDPAACRAAVAVMDSKGLIVDDAAAMDDYKRELAWPAAAAAALGLDAAHRGLADVVRRWRPTVLLGTSGQAGAFTEAIVRTMAAAVDRPVILPLSNPTSSCEALPDDVIAWTGGRALVATGSPFADVHHGGRCHRIGQGNNAFIFPGVGLAVLAAGLRAVDDGMFLDAAHALASAVSADELESGLVYPPIARLRDVSRAIATAVLAGRGINASTADALLARATWAPRYREYVPA